MLTSANDGASLRCPKAFLFTVASNLAIDSLRRVLALQPKHFIAMAELGQILEEFDDKNRALDAYRKAKELDPFIDGLDDRIRQLSKEVEGQGI